MEVIFIGSLILNSLAFLEFWVFGAIIKKQYEGLRNFFLRNRGFGYLLIRMPEGRIIKKFSKLSNTESVMVQNKLYMIKSERVYRYEGLPTLVYNFGDSMPLKLEEMKKDELWANAEWQNNIYLNIKAAAEAEAEAKNNIKVVLLYLIAGLCVLSLTAIAYLLYMLTSGDAGVVINAKP